MGSASGRLIIRVIGPFRVLSEDGEDLTPRSRKACALIALLALAPNMRRSREWLQKMLWSDRGLEQGSASLRQTLTEIRRALGDRRHCLVTEREMVVLDHDFVTIDQGPSDAAARAGQILLDGLVARDGKFDAWLQEERRRFEHAQRNNSVRAGEVVDEGVSPRPAARRGELYLIDRPDSGRGAELILARSAADLVARFVSDSGAADLFDHRSEPAATPSGRGARQLAMHTEIGRIGGTRLLRVVLRDLRNKRMISADPVAVGENPLEDTNVLRSLSSASQAAIEALSERDGDEALTAAHLCTKGVRCLLSLGSANFEQADQLFAQAFELDRNGVYLAWRAYLRTFLIAERTDVCQQQAKDEATDFAARALEMEPNNAIVASLCAHVHAIASLNFYSAYELASRSVELNQATPLGWACLGMAESHVGRPEKGFEYIKKARSIAGATPLRRHIDALACIVGVMSNNVDEAVHCGEASHTAAPAFAAPLRFLTALYFHRRDEAGAERTMQKLRLVEPDFSIELLREPGYPAESLRKSALMASLPTR